MDELRKLKNEEKSIISLLKSIIHPYSSYHLLLVNELVDL